MTHLVLALLLAASPAHARSKPAPKPDPAPVAEPAASDDSPGGVTGGVVGPVRAMPTDPALVADIRTLLNLTGAGRLAIQSMLATLEQMKKVRADIPPSFWDAFMAEVKEDELVDLLIPVYAAHFSREDVAGLVAFYQTPVGQKLIAETPGITSEAMTVGQSWGSELAMRVVTKMQAAPDAPAH